MVGTLALEASVTGAVGIFVVGIVGAGVVGAVVVGVRVVEAGLMQQMSLCFEQSKGFCGKVCGQIATQTPSRPPKPHLLRGARARESADELLLPGMPGVAGDVVVGAGVVSTGAPPRMKHFIPRPGTRARTQI